MDGVALATPAPLEMRRDEPVDPHHVGSLTVAATRRPRERRGPQDKAKGVTWRFAGLMSDEDTHRMSAQPVEIPPGLLGILAERPLTVADLFEDETPGRKEIVDGGLFVSPLADYAHQRLVATPRSPARRHAAARQWNRGASGRQHLAGSSTPW